MELRNQTGPEFAPPDTEGRFRFLFAAALILALGAGVRLYGAWAGRQIEDGDAAVTALMARHMVEGRGFPIFFYGQGYMGNLEPATAALFGLLFGLNGFWVNMSVAVYGWLVLLLLLRWGREIGGRLGALLAALLCMIGPRYYAALQTVPRGAYMAAILLSTWALWQCARLSVRLRQGKEVGAGWPLMIGLAAGLAWWGTALITSALIAGALLIVIGLRGRLWNRVVLWGLIGFFIGSAPFWWWNAQHGWISLRMGGEIGGVSLREGLSYLAKAWRRMAQISGGSEKIGAVLGLTLLAMGAGGTVAGAVEWRRRGWTLVSAASVGLTLHVIIAGWLFAYSEFAPMSAPRYLLHVAPALALLTGIAAGAVAARPAAALGFSVVALLLTASHFPHLQRLRARAEWSAAQGERDRELAAALAASEVEAVYANFFKHYRLNFVLGERWPFTEPRNERILEYGRRAEYADRVGFLDDIFRVADFVAASGGRMRQQTVGGVRLASDFEPPSLALSEIATADWSAVTDAAGSDLRALIADRDADTGWRYDGARRPQDGIEIRFSSPRRARRLRLTFGEGRFFDVVAGIETLDPVSGEWRTVVAPRGLPQLFWSGPRPYRRGRRLRIEYELSGAPVSGLRWQIAPSPRGVAPEVRAVLEAQVFEMSETDLPSEMESVEALVALLKERGVARAYADRWLSNTLAKRAPEIAVDAEPGIWRRSLPRDMDDGRIEWRSGAAVIVLRFDAPQTRAALGALSAAPLEVESGPWTVFLAPPGASPEPGGLPPPVFWSGCTAFRGQGIARDFERLRAAVDRLERAGETADLGELLSGLLAKDPQLLATADPALRRLEQRAPEVIPPEVRAEWRRRTVPGVSLEASFPGGLRLAGVTIEPEAVAPGEPLRVRYIWQIPPPERERREWATFVHFTAGGVRFQDDHSLPDSAPWAALFDPEAPGLYSEERSVRVPPEAPAGPIELAIGVYDNASRARLRVKTSHPTRDNAVLARLGTVIAPATP